MLKEPFVWFVVRDFLKENDITSFQSQKTDNIGLAFNYLNKDKEYIKFTTALKSQLKLPVKYYVSLWGLENMRPDIGPTDEVLLIDVRYDTNHLFVKDYIPYINSVYSDEGSFDPEMLLICMYDYFNTKILMPEKDIPVYISYDVTRNLRKVILALTKLGVSTLMLQFSSKNLRKVIETKPLINKNVIETPKDFDKKIKDYRKQIDEIDNQYFDTIARRFELVKEIGIYKDKCGLPIFEPKRYGELLAKYKKKSQDLKINEDTAVEFFEEIHLFGLTKLLEKIIK